MSKRMRWMVIGLSIVFGGLIAFNVIKGMIMGYFFSHYVPPAVTVSSVVVRETAWEPRLHAVGNFLAINGVDVNAETSGKIVNIYFQSGQYVKKDDPLLDIEDSVDQATLKYNQADLTLQELNYKRQQELIKTKSTAGASVDEALAKLVEAKATLEKTEALIRQKHIKAPFTGQLGIRMVNLGEYMVPGQTAIVTLQSLDPLYLEFYLPEQNLNRVHLGQKVYITVQQYPNLRFEGNITAINPKAETQTHNIKLQATLANCPIDDTHIKIKPLANNNKKLASCQTDINTQNNISLFRFIPGMFAALEIEQPPLPKQIVLPSTAISYSLYGDSVFIIEQDKNHPKDDAGQDLLTVKRVFVTTGGQQGNDTLITQGVTPGQRVVSSGELKLQDGTRVIINNDILLKAHQPNTLSE